jgi:hypothetical protein
MALGNDRVRDKRNAQKGPICPKIQKTKQGTYGSLSSFVSTQTSI